MQSAAKGLAAYAIDLRGRGRSEGERYYVEKRRACSRNTNQIRGSYGEMSAPNLKTRTGLATRLVAGVLVPDTPVISRAIEFARERSEPYLFNHAMRSWLFASMIAQRNQ